MADFTISDDSPKNRWQMELFFKWIKYQIASADKIIFRLFKNCCQNTNQDHNLCVSFVVGHHEKAPEFGAESLHNFTNF